MRTCKCGQPITHQITAETDNGQRFIRCCRAHLDKAAELAVGKHKQGEYDAYAIETIGS